MQPSSASHNASVVVLNLVVIRSADFDRAETFYRALGLSFVRHRHGAGPEHLSCELGPLVFEIYPHTPSASPGGQSPSPVRIGFRVPSVDAAVEGLRAIGAVVVSPPKDSPWGRRAVVDDFDENRVELTAILLKNE